MPERVTREERMVSLAIEKARKAKQELSSKKRMNIEPTQVNEFDSEVEVQKIKRPKVQDASKITNQTQDKEGYGLAGETLKKAEDERTKRIADIGYRQMLDKVEADIRRAFRETIDSDALMTVMMPHGRSKETYKNKEEMIEQLVKETINRIKKK
jgi:hypothetical protein